MIITLLKINNLCILLYALIYIIWHYDNLSKEGKKGFIGYFIAYALMFIYMCHDFVFDLSVTQIDMRSLMP
jgi:hypothetical protein